MSTCNVSVFFFFYNNVMFKSIDKKLYIEEKQYKCMHSNMTKIIMKIIKYDLINEVCRLYCPNGRKYLEI